MIQALAVLLLCQLLGEAAARALALPVPGPLIGMVLLFAGLLWRGEREEKEGAVPPALFVTADALLANLGLLFVPAGVGVMLYLPLLAEDWLGISLAILLGTLVTMALTGRLAQALFRRWG